jgi:hypothetical protein
VKNKVEVMWEEMVAYLSVLYSYLKGVQKTRRAWTGVKRGVEQSTVHYPHCERPEDT